MSGSPATVRYLRCCLAAAISLVFAWYCFHALDWLARSAGVIAVVHYTPAVKQWLLIGDPLLQSWHQVSVSRDFTLAGTAMMSLTVVLTYYVAQLAYGRRLATVFQRRDRWLLAGWLVGVPLIATEGHLLLTLLSTATFVQHWPNLVATGVLALFLISANVYAELWGWIMRKRRVSHPSHDH